MSNTKLEKEPLTVADIRAIAKSRLPKRVWEYYSTGADDEQTLHRNNEVFKEYAH